MRQFMESGNPTLLDNFDATRRELPSMFAALRTAATKPEDQEKARQLEALVNETLLTAAEARREFEQHQAMTAEVKTLIAKVIVDMNRAVALYTPWRQQLLTNIAEVDRQEKLKLRATGWYALAIGFVGATLALLLSGALLRHMRQRAKMAHQLQLSSELWRGTLGNLVQGVAVFGMDRRLFFWNEQFARLTGVPVELLHTGMTLAEVIQASIPFVGLDSETEIHEANTAIEMVRGKQPVQFERQRIDGTVMRCDIRPVSDDYYVAAITDITAIRGSEAQARDQATRLAAIMDNVADGIITINSSGNIESWSEGARRMFGYGAEELLRHEFKLLLDETQTAAPDDLRHYLQGRLDRQIGGRHQLMARHRDGHSFPIDLVLSEVQIAGQRMLVGIVRDITEQRRVEQMKSEFISTVSHELRTPLTSIRGSLGLLTGAASDALPARSQRLLSIALQNSERLTRLINDILDMEKAESGQLNLVLAPQSLRALAAQAIEAHRAYAEGHQVNFRLHHDATELPVIADADRIMQVLANLLSNAAKFSPAGSDVIVKVQRRGARMRLSVHDQGPGIPAEFHARIFSRFAQADASDSRQKGGSGLGLAIAKSLIELHGGQIGFGNNNSADTGANPGAVFWFELPARQHQTEPAFVLSSRQTG